MVRWSLLRDIHRHVLAVIGIVHSVGDLHRSIVHVWGMHVVGSTGVRRRTDEHGLLLSWVAHGITFVRHKAGLIGDVLFGTARWCGSCTFGDKFRHCSR